MAAMDQQKLNSMCSTINSQASDYASKLTAEAKNMVSTFNENWVSNSSQELANEIKECLVSLENAITTRFEEKNSDIKKAVDNFNYVEGESIAYPGFSFSKPALDFALNATLPNGKRGVKDGADLATFNNPMNSLVSGVSNVLDSIASAVKSADAFDENEQNALAGAISTIKTNFVSSMDELQNSLKTRMDSEITVRDAADKSSASYLAS